mmetsp:Transcript_10624/g.21840  ORF Transcript_10624/g.21840 Transcript_10624/m.21840 type:complete len:446 (+) Transcript_10624:2-1339(+)
MGLFTLFLLLLVSLSPVVADTTSQALEQVFVTSPEEFGAVGDGSADDSDAISKALASCTDQLLPCHIVFAKHYLSGPILLERSEITLEVNGHLSMLPRKAYCKSEDCKSPSQGSFIANSVTSSPCRNVTTVAGNYEVCMSDIRITGSGTISSTSPWQWWPCKYLPCRVDFRPHLIVLQKVERVTIEGVTLKDAPNHNVEIGECVTNRLHDLTITAPYISPNTDGVNFYGGFDSILEDSIIDNGDDCISVVPLLDDLDYCAVSKDDTDIICSGGHVLVRNITCNGGHGLSIGGIRHGNVHNVTFENIVVTGGQKGSTQDEAAGGGCRVKSYPNGTGVVRDIRYKDIVFDDVYLPIQILGHYCPFPCNTPDGDQSVLFKDLSFENISGSGKQRNTVIELKCSEYEPCRNITMNNISLVAKNGKEGKLTCENVEGVHIDSESSPNECS